MLMRWIELNGCYWASGLSDDEIKDLDKVKLFDVLGTSGRV